MENPNAPLASDAENHIDASEVDRNENPLVQVVHEAEEGVVLILDEADALFGKRTEVKDSHDRYANDKT